MNASQLVSYDFFKDLLQSHMSLENGMPLHLLSSAASGTVATTICAPADVVKSRVMNASAGSSVMGILRDSLKAEGPRFLFRGWLPAWSEYPSEPTDASPPDAQYRVHVCVLGAIEKGGRLY